MFTKPAVLTYDHSFANGYVNQALIQTRSGNTSPFLNINNKVILTNDESYAISFIDSSPSEVMVVFIREKDAVVYTKDVGITQYTSQSEARAAIDNHLQPPAEENLPE